MKIASFNVQNLFERAVALSAAAGGADATLIAQAEVNALLRKADYSEGDRTKILQLLTRSGCATTTTAASVVMLRQNRGQLVRRHAERPVEIVARGRKDWVGWVELEDGASTR